MAGRDVGIEGVVKPRGRPVWRTSNNARKREPNNPAMRASRNAHSAPVAGFPSQGGRPSRLSAGQDSKRFEWQTRLT